MNLKTLPFEHRLAHQAVVMTRESDLALEDAVEQLVSIELQSETDQVSASWPNSHTTPNILAIAGSIEQLLSEGADEWKVGRRMINPVTDKDSMHVFYLKLAVAHGLISRNQACAAMWAPTPSPSHLEFFFMKADNLWNLAHWEMKFHEALSSTDNPNHLEIAV